MESYSLTLDEACQFLVRYPVPTATNWIRTGRLQATRKDQPSQNLLTSQHGKPALRRFSLRCILSRSAGDGITEEKKMSLFRRNEIWYASYSLPGGKRIQVFLAQKDKRQAQELHDKRKADSGERKQGIYLMSLLKRPA